MVNYQTHGYFDTLVWLPKMQLIAPDTKSAVLLYYDTTKE